MTQGPEPTGYELQRSIDRVEKNMNQGITDIKLLIAGLVSRDLFDFESRTQNDRILALEKDFARFKEDHSAATWRFWAQIFIPILAIAVSVAIVLIG